MKKEMEKLSRENKSQNKSESRRERKSSRDLLFLGFALFILFIIFFWILSNPKSASPATSPNPRINGSIQEFKESLINAQTLAIVEDVTSLPSNNTRYVYSCGAGLAGSWGKIGKNISNLYVFVIDGNECTFSSPKLVENQLSNESTVVTKEECMSMIKQLDENPTHVTFYIQYGPLYSLYYTKTAYLFVNEQFGEECSFRISDSTPGVLAGS